MWTVLREKNWPFTYNARPANVNGRFGSERVASRLVDIAKRSRAGMEESEPWK